MKRRSSGSELKGNPKNGYLLQGYLLRGSFSSSGSQKSWDPTHKIPTSLHDGCLNSKLLVCHQNGFPKECKIPERRKSDNLANNLLDAGNEKHDANNLNKDLNLLLQNPTKKRVPNHNLVFRGETWISKSIRKIRVLYCYYTGFVRFLYGFQEAKPGSSTENPVFDEWQVQNLVFAAHPKFL